MMNKFRNWLPLAVAITVLCGLVFVIAQQTIRMNANDPQVEISEELARAVVEVEEPAQFDSPQKLDISQVLSAFWVVYDEQGNALASSGQLNGQLPGIPKNALDLAKQKGENRITWQPQEGVRQAVVIKPYSGKTAGFVAAGKSLRETDKRINTLLIYTLLAWIIAMAGSLIASLFPPKPEAHHTHEHHDHQHAG